MLRADPRTLRTGTQTVFLALCAWIGVDFARFMRWGLAGGAAPYAAHPAGAEGFLPISALLSLKYLLVSGRVHGGVSTEWLSLKLDGKPVRPNLSGACGKRVYLTRCRDR